MTDNLNDFTLAKENAFKIAELARKISEIIFELQTNSEGRVTHSHDKISRENKELRIAVEFWKEAFVKAKRWEALTLTSGRFNYKAAWDAAVKYISSMEEELEELLRKER